MLRPYTWGVGSPTCQVHPVRVQAGWEDRRSLLEKSEPGRRQGSVIPAGEKIEDAASCLGGIWKAVAMEGLEKLQIMHEREQYA